MRKIQKNNITSIKNKIKGNLLMALIAFLILAILIPINHALFSDSPDNPIEELEEEVIERTLGVDIDLSQEGDDFD